VTIPNEELTMYKLIAIALAALFIPMLAAKGMLATMPPLKTPSLPLLVFIAIAAVQFLIAVVFLGSHPADKT
jgi:hypothetical protein